MKRFITLFMSFFLLITSLFSNGQPVHAANGAHIVSIVNWGMLLDDGSIWANNVDGSVQKNLGVVAIAGDDDHNGYGVTISGELVTWDYISAPHVDTKQTGIKQIANGYYLKQDGTVWSTGGQRQQGYNGMALIAANDNMFSTVSTTGEIRSSSLKMPLAQGTGTDSIIAIDVAEHGDTAVLDSSGTVTKYDLTHYDYSGSTISIMPEVITQNAASIEYTANNLLLVTLKDGTVWVTGETNDRYKLTEQIDEIGNGVVKTANAKDKNTFAYQLSDGSWKQYDDGVISNIEIPSLSGINFTLSSTKPYVGDSTKATIIESYSNGTKKTIPLSQANVTIEKPYLLKKNSDGTFKALAVGVTKVTVTSGSLTKTLTVAISLPSHLTNAVQKNNVTFLPVQSVFRALGGTVVYTSSSKTFDIKVGATSIRLKQGDSNAKVNGNHIAMSAALRSENNTTVFPASLLSKVFGATLKWDSKYKIIKISFGNATFSVETPDTAKIHKKELLGNLSSYIGKSYWVNHFQGWDRFNKLTITDIIPDSQGYYFTIVFKKTNGTQLKSYEMARDNVVNLFTGSYYFLNYDPYKKYKWSASTWKLIKEEMVATGMTKDQVLLSIGQPTSTSKLTGNGITVETWGYGYFNYVTFVNGKVTSIYTS